MKHLKTFDESTRTYIGKKPQTISIGEMVNYRNELCKVVYKHESGLYNLERPNGRYWYGVHPWYVEKLNDENEI